MIVVWYDLEMVSFHKLANFKLTNTAGIHKYQ